jgi:hypothetical protein
MADIIEPSLLYISEELPALECTGKAEIACGERRHGKNKQKRLY